MGSRRLTLQCLDGLSVGDAFGEQFFRVSPDAIATRSLPDGPWIWTDDTHMALSIVEVLFEHGSIDQDALTQRFAQRFTDQPWRGYAGGAQHLLTRYARGADWRREAGKLFNGGSYGNGGAMRAAPIGAFYAADPERAVAEAERSAAVTHAHPEGRAGAIAVAVAGAIVSAAAPPTGVELLRQIIPYVPLSNTREGIEDATRIGGHEHARAVSALGTGNRVAAFDTVPYCLWIVAHHSNSYESALWKTLAGRGDMDTTCAIVGGIVAITCPIPPTWLERREPLPKGFALDEF